MIQLNIIAITPNGNRCEYPIEFPENKGIREDDKWLDGYDYHLFLDTLSKILAVESDIIELTSSTLEMDESGIMKFVSETSNIIIHLDNDSYKFWHRKKIINDVI